MLLATDMLVHGTILHTFKNIAPDYSMWVIDNDGH